MTWSTECTPRHLIPETAGSLVAAVIAECVPMGRKPGAPADPTPDPATEPRSFELDLASLEPIGPEAAAIVALDDIFAQWS